MIDGDDRLSEEQARRVWKRAAELQSAATDQQPRAPKGAADAEPETGYDLDQIRAAAAGADIDPEFLALALAEEQPPGLDHGDWADRWVQRVGGAEPRVLVASHRFDGSIDEAHRALLSVFGRHQIEPVGMQRLRHDRGPLVFALPPAHWAAGDAPISDLVTRTRVQKLLVHLMPIDDGSCVVTISASLEAARRARSGNEVALTGGAGVVGGWVAGALGAFLAISTGMVGAAEAATIGGAIALGFGAGISAAVAGLRATYRAGRRNGTAALEGLLRSIGGEVGKPALPPPPGATTEDR